MKKAKIIRSLSLLLVFCLVLLSLSSCIKAAYAGLDYAGGAGEGKSSDRIVEDSEALDEISSTQTVAEVEETDISELSSKSETTAQEQTTTESTTVSPSTTKPTTTKPATAAPSTTKPTTTKPTTTNPTTTKAPQTTKSTTAPPSSYRPDGDKGLMFDSINRERTSRGLAPLVWDTNVAAAAQDKADEMNKLNRFDHVSPTYGTTRNMLANQRKLNVNWVGENLSGNKCVNDAHCGLMNSQKHKENILNPNYTHVGIGVAPHPKYGKVFVIMFVSYKYW